MKWTYTSLGNREVKHIEQRTSYSRVWGNPEFTTRYNVWTQYIFIGKISLRKNWALLEYKVTKFSIRREWTDMY